MRYWRIANGEGKVWLMPRKNVRVALALYQPSGWRGKAMKMLLPLASAFPERLTPFPVLECELESPIREKLERIFAGKKLEWAVFEGTPSVHQKQVIQVFSGQEILAYCKISTKADIINLFAQEAELLHELRMKGISSIPSCLYLGPVGNEGKQMLVLSTEKTIHSKVPYGWSVAQQTFVDELQAKTARMIPFEECDLSRAIALLRERYALLPECIDKERLGQALEYSENLCHGKILKCAVMHGDFTPWNMTVEKGHLFVFDWEYAFRSCPVGLDRYHFFTQTAFFERHWSAERLIAFAQSPNGSWMKTDQLVNYLLLILSRFVGREPADRKMADTPLLAYWNQLIILCLKTK